MVLLLYLGMKKRDNIMKNDKVKSTDEDAGQKLFKPKLLNRIDETIVFRNRSIDDIKEIIDIEMKELVQNIEANKMEIQLDKAAMNFLAEKGYDEKFGARPLRRAIQKFIEDPLSEELLMGNIKEGHTIIVKHKKNAEHLHFVTKEPKTAAKEDTAAEKDIESASDAAE